MAFRIEHITYTLGEPTVAIAVRRAAGLLAGNTVDLYTTQDALAALATAKGAAEWSDAEVVAEAERLLGEKGEVLTPDMLAYKPVAVEPL